MKGWHKNEQKQFFQAREDMIAFGHQQDNILPEGALISQGAEGKVYCSQFLSNIAVVKERLKKNYRVMALDAKINRTRLLQEARCMLKCSQIGVKTPNIYMVDTIQHRLCMEYIHGLTFKAILYRDLREGEEATAPAYTAHHELIARKVGEAIARIHAADIIHGDLTTSNIMISAGAAEEVTIIDFGLGAMQAVTEDKAVDLYVLERSFLATHPNSEHLVKCIMDSYEALFAEHRTAARIPTTQQDDQDQSGQSDASAIEGRKKGKQQKRKRSDSEELANQYDKCAAVLKRLENVRARGRKREMFG